MDTQSQGVVIFLAVIVGLAALGFGIPFFVRRSRTLRPLLNLPKPVEIARIEQTSDLTVGGAIAAVLMVMFNVTALFAYWSASTVLQQTVAVLSSISASAFWGVFVIVGQKHSYRVLRDQEPIEPPP